MAGSPVVVCLCGLCEFPVRSLHCFGPEPSICTVAAATTLLFVPRRLLTSRGTAIQDVECTDWIQPREGDPTYLHLVEKDLFVWLMYKSIKSRCP